MHNLPAHYIPYQQQDACGHGNNKLKCLNTSGLNLINHLLQKKHLLNILYIYLKSSVGCSQF